MKSFKTRLFMSFYIFFLTISLRASDDDGFRLPGRTTARPSFHRSTNLDLDSLSSTDDPIAPFSATAYPASARFQRRLSVAERFAASEGLGSESCLEDSNGSTRSRASSRNRRRTVVIQSPPSERLEEPSAIATSSRGLTAQQEAQVDFILGRQRTTNATQPSEVFQPRTPTRTPKRRQSASTARIAERLAQLELEAAISDLATDHPMLSPPSHHAAMPASRRKQSMQVTDLDEFRAFESSTNSLGSERGSTSLRSIEESATATPQDEHIGKNYDECIIHSDPATPLKAFVDDFDEEHNSVPRFAEQATCIGGALTTAFGLKKAYDHHTQPRTRFVGEAMAASGLAVGLLKGVVGCVTVAYTYYKVRKWLYQDYVKKKRLEETKQELLRRLAEVSQAGKKAHLDDKRRIEELERQTAVILSKQRELIAANQNHAADIDRLFAGTDHGKMKKDILELFRVTTEHGQSLEDCEADFMEIERGRRENEDAINELIRESQKSFSRTRDTASAILYLSATQHKVLMQSQAIATKAPEQEEIAQQIANVEKILAKLEHIAQEKAPAIASVHYTSALKHHQNHADLPVEQAATVVKEKHKPAARVEYAPKKKPWYKRLCSCCDENSVQTREPSADQLAALQAEIAALKAAQDQKETGSTAATE